MIKAIVDFSKKLRDWDGFGVNYVETCQTTDYFQNPQDYGGFSTLTEEKRQEILDLVFCQDGLKPSVVKMFFDPFHQDISKQNEFGFDKLDMRNYDHETSSKWTRYFAKEGLKRTRARGKDLQIITTLYGPPGWMTKQKFLRGRDLNPLYTEELAKYFVAWAKYLKETEGLPVKYISLHNEGEDYVRWPFDGSLSYMEHGHDYNMYWPPEQVIEFIKLVHEVLLANKLDDIGVTPGEMTNWLRFYEWGYADAIADDDEAMEKLALVSSHGFVSHGAYHQNRWFSDARSTGVDILREKKPELHCWTTSISWDNMDVCFLDDFRHNIYNAKVNSIIPWACIQWSAMWAKGDPNPGTAFRVDGKGGYTVEPGYYYYKQLSTAGQAGMAVSRVFCNDTELGVLAFANNNSGNTNAFVLLNTSKENKKVDIYVKGGNSRSYKAFRTSCSESYIELGVFEIMDDMFSYVVPFGSATTFFENK